MAEALMALIGRSNRALRFGHFLRNTLAAQIHLLALIATLVAAEAMVARAWESSAAHFVASFVYSATAAMVFLVSSAYHFLHDGIGISERAMHVMEKMDHTAIYLFIAGTYTPVLLIKIDAAWKWQLLALVWGLAVLGVIYTLFSERLPAFLRSRLIYTGIFVAMGWSFLLEGRSILTALDAYEIICLTAGGGAYTVGAMVYVRKSPNFRPGFFGYHELWHLFVVIGSFFHFLMIRSVLWS